MKETHTFSIPFVGTQAERATRYRELQKEASTILMELGKEAREHPHVRCAAMLTRWHGAPEVSLTKDGFSISFITGKDEPKKPATPYIDPKTVNLMLSGKLLTDQEKRGLIATCFPQLADVIPSGGAADPGEGYTGPIEVGMRFIWEPTNPGARERIEVVKILDPTADGDEAMIFAKPLGTMRKDHPGYPNDESRFREAVVRMAEDA